jgi:hypothetical protein
LRRGRGDRAIRRAQAQSRVNDEWIAATEPVVARLAPDVTTRIAATYDTS